MTRPALRSLPDRSSTSIRGIRLPTRSVRRHARTRNWCAIRAWSTVAITVNATSESAFGRSRVARALAGETFRDNRGTPSYSRVDLLAGYRYLQLKDHLTIADNFGSLDPDIPVEYQITDQFDTSNEFQGADLGIVWQGGWKKWTLEGLLRTAWVTSIRR